MFGVANIVERKRNALALGLLAFALFLRLVVPAGWMPVAGGGFAITLCTGMGAVEAWVDENGDVHKKAPEPTGNTDQPCTFAWLSAALTTPGEIGAMAPLALAMIRTLVMRVAEVAIGRGLAAPPPPPTGPPASL